MQKIESSLTNSLCFFSHGDRFDEKAMSQYNKPIF